MPKGPKGEKRSADVIGNAVRLWGFEEIIAGMDAIAPKAGRPKTYKKREEKNGEIL